MLSVEKLSEQRNRSNTALKELEEILERINALITGFENDRTHSQEYKSQKIAEEREKLTPKAGELYKLIAEAAKATAQQKQFWENRTYLLSLQAANDDPATDALIKLQWESEYKDMPPVLMQTAYEDARFDLNLAKLWVIFRLGTLRSHQTKEFRESVSMTLEGIELPDQAEALAAISTCWSNDAHAGHIISMILGTREDPMRKMSVGRMQQSTNRFVASSDQVAAAKKAEADAQALEAAEAISA